MYDDLLILILEIRAGDHSHSTTSNTPPESSQYRAKPALGDICPRFFALPRNSFTKKSESHFNKVIFILTEVILIPIK